MSYYHCHITSKDHSHEDTAYTRSEAHLIIHEALLGADMTASQSEWVPLSASYVLATRALDLSEEKGEASVWLGRAPAGRVEVRVWYRDTNSADALDVG